MITTRPDCKYIAYLYANDRTHFDKPGCLKGHGSWPNDWTCKLCYDFAKNPKYQERHKIGTRDEAMDKLLLEFAKRRAKT